MKVGDLVRWGPFTWDDDVDKTGVTENHEDLNEPFADI